MNSGTGVKKRDFLTVWDFSAGEIAELLQRAAEIKAGASQEYRPLAGKSLGLIFEKTSTRTRISFEVGIYQLGAQAVYVRPQDSQLGRGETMPDTARVLSRYFHGVVIRTFGHKRIEEFARYASVPVINGLTNEHHPCQILADLLTVKERKDALSGIKIAYIGDGNNIANSLMEASSRMGMILTLACPKGYEPSLEILHRAQQEGKGHIRIVNDPKEAALGADVLYTDVWVSMGDDETTAKEKKSKLREFQINEELLSLAAHEAMVMHCLPAHRGEEITDGVMDGPCSAVFDQAENRLHTQKAVLEFLIR